MKKGILSLIAVVTLGLGVSPGSSTAQALQGAAPATVAVTMTDTITTTHVIHVLNVTTVTANATLRNQKYIFRMPVRHFTNPLPFWVGSCSLFNNDTSRQVTDFKCLGIIDSDDLVDTNEE